MTKNQFVGHWICWPYTFSDSRSEQTLYEDGRFEGMLVDETLKLNFSAKGNWDLVDGAIQWTYGSAKGGKKPRRPQLDKVMLLEENHFVIMEGKGPATTEHWRGVPCDDTSTNFDLDEVRPFLRKLAGYIDEGFADPEITGLMKKIRNLGVHQRLQTIFPIKFQGVANPLYIGVFMDDTDAPDISFSAPIELIKKIECEIEKRAN